MLRHPWLGGGECEAARDHRRALIDRREKEAQTLAWPKGWDINESRGNMGKPGQDLADPLPVLGRKKGVRAWALSSFG